jgi:hypothetical protein
LDGFAMFSHLNGAKDRRKEAGNEFASLREALVEGRFAGARQFLDDLDPDDALDHIFSVGWKEWIPGEAWNTELVAFLKREFDLEAYRAGGCPQVDGECLWDKWLANYINEECFDPAVADWFLDFFGVSLAGKILDGPYVGPSSKALPWAVAKGWLPLETARKQAVASLLQRIHGVAKTYAGRNCSPSRSLFRYPSILILPRIFSTPVPLLVAIALRQRLSRTYRGDVVNPPRGRAQHSALCTGG